MTYFKKLFYPVLLILAALQVQAQIQDFHCPMADVTDFTQVKGFSTNGLLSSSGLAFFAGNEGCTRVTLDVNYIFLYKDDGTGNWNFNDPDEFAYLSSVLDRSDNTLRNIWSGGCPDGSSYSGIQVNSTIHQINDTDAWNLSQCNATIVGSPCGDDRDLCNDSAYDAIIDGVIASIGGEDAINVYFAVEGDVWNAEYATGNYLTTCNRPAQNINFWTGRFPNPNDLTQLNKSQIANFYLSYLFRRDQPECYLDSNGNPYDPADIMLWFEQGSGWTLAHEIGHTLGLTHHSCQGNLMNTTPGGRLTNAQVARINRSIAMKNVRSSRRDCSMNVGCAYTLAQDQSLTIDHDTWIDRDIIIEAGAVLVVEERLSMADGAKIVVEENGKLIVDGGVITSCGDKWEGIQVYGGINGYDVEVKNNALIENTSKAAVSMYASGGWLLNDGNAVVLLENSEFKNCHRMLAMGAINNSYNPSIIDNCVHNQGKWSITNWNCFGVRITNNIFNNISNECVVSSTGQFHIEGNEFNSGRADILFANPTLGFGTDIYNNEFKGANTGIRSLGASLGQTEIRENQFFAGEFDMFMDGDNNYRIRENDITADFGLVSTNAGTHSNEVHNNLVTGCFVGFMPLEINGAYIFYNNCFNTSFADNYIEGTVGPVQANPQTFETANNCFTHAGLVTHPTFDMTGNPNQFTYVEPNDASIDCKDPEKAHQNILPANLGDGSNICDEAGSGNGNIPPQYNPCNPPKDEQSLWIALSWLRNKINEIENNPNLTREQKDMYIFFYERCLGRVEGFWFEKKFENEAYEDVRSYVGTSRDNDDILVVYSSYMLAGDYAAANNYLDNIQAPNSDMLDFIAVQKVYLSAIANESRVVSATTLASISSIAGNNHPYAGYAKALYYWLTGDILSSDIPDLRGSSPRSIGGATTVENIRMYPNPFRDQLSLAISSVDPYELSVYDAFGRQVYTQQTEGNLTINTAEWANGLYLVNMSRGDKIIHHEKVVLIK